VPASLHHLALRVASVERSVEFYAGLLGLAELSRHAGDDGTLRAVWLDLGGGASGPILMLERSLRGRGADEGSAHVLALTTDDLDRAEASLLAAGVAIDDRTGYTLFCRDPDGHRLGLSIFDRSVARRRG